MNPIPTPALDDRLGWIGRRTSGEQIELLVETTFRDDLARKLIHEANERGVEPVELLATIIENVLRDDLVSAVVDL